jgi:hypothetical protein
MAAIEEHPADQNDRVKAAKMDQPQSSRVTHPMVPVIEDIRPELRSNGLDRRQCCWYVRYRFCDLSAEIALYAENEADARARAVDQLRRRGLKVA